MTETTQTDQTGVERTGAGEIVDQSPSAKEALSQTTNQETKPEQKAEEGKEGKTLLTEGKKEEPKKEEPKKAEVKGAPEKYEDYKVPEGYTLDPEIKGEADKLFKGLGLDQAQAQSLVDFYTAKTTEAFQAPFTAYKEMTDSWRTEAESHPDLRGKLGPGQEVNVRISKALDALSDPKLASDFKELMDITGAGNHQAFIRVIDKLAQRMTEGTHVAGNGPSKAGQSAPGAAPPSAAAAMWPTLPSAQNR
jgi:hypothetical protein